MLCAGKPAKAAVGKAALGKGSAAPVRGSATSARPASKGKDPAAEKRAQQLAQEAEVRPQYKLYEISEPCCRQARPIAGSGGRAGILDTC